MLCIWNGIGSGTGSLAVDAVFIAVGTLYAVQGLCRRLAPTNEQKIGEEKSNWEDGSVIAGTTKHLVKFDACSEFQWINDEVIAHHSIEPNHNGNFWVSSSMEPGNRRLPSKEFNHSITMISPDNSGR